MGVTENEFMKQYGALIKSTASSLGLSKEEKKRLDEIMANYNKSGTTSAADEDWMKKMLKKYGGGLPGEVPL